MSTKHLCIANKIALACVSYFFVGISALVAGVQPMVFELAPSGAAASTVLTVTNDGLVPLDIEVVPHGIAIDEFGRETRFSGDDDLRVVPSVALIQAGRSQAIEVRYVGDPEIIQSRPYRVSVMQVPVNNGTAKGAIMATNIHTLLNVVPENSSPNLRVTSINEQSEDGKWLLEISNSGDRFARLSQTRWMLSAGERYVVLSAMDVARRADKNMVLPNSSLSFEFNPPEGFKPAETIIDIDAGT